MENKLRVILMGVSLGATVLQIYWTVHSIGVNNRTAKAEERIADALESKNG